MARGVPWTIAKAAGSLSLDQANLTLNYGAPTGTITVTRAGDGVITAQSNHPNIATVSVSGNTVTVTGKANGSTTITVKIAEGTNHTAPADMTCSVTVIFKPIAKTSATSGVSYSSGISGITQSKLSEYGEAISNNGAITNTTSTIYIDDGSSNYKISIGDTVTISVDGANYAFRIIGFNHDELTVSTAYGAATATGKAGITFQMVDCLAKGYPMNNIDHNIGGWGKSKMRTTLQVIRNTIDSDWMKITKLVNKKTSDGEMRTTISSTQDRLFLLADIEVAGNSGFSMPSEGTPYAWYKAGNTRIKRKNGALTGWWLRSPGLNFGRVFCVVSTDGSVFSSVGNCGASNEYSVAFGFCV